MASHAIERVLSRLSDARRAGKGWSARCPAHRDSTASLSVHEGTDGRALVHCFAGCAASRIVEALGLATSDLFPDSAASVPTRTARRGITLAELADAKAIPAEFLRALGLRDLDRGVLIPYLAADGTLLARQRLRTALKAGAGSSWLPGEGPVVPYGLDRLAAARAGGLLVLVEGESDCWTCWLHGFPALGIPGAGAAKSLQADHLAGFSRLYLVHEPDAGGDAFVAGVTARLAHLRWTGTAFEVRLDGAKDPNALHQRDPGAFPDGLRSALDRGVPVALSGMPCVSEDSIEPNWLEDLLLDSGLSRLGADAPMPAIEAALRRLGSGAVDLDTLQLRLLREATIRRLDECGLRAGAGTFDAVFEGHASVKDVENTPGRGLTLSPPEPSSEPVDGVRLLDELAATFRRHVALPEGAAEAQALWIVHSYALDAAFASPLLALTSPEKRCGKTTNLEVLAALASCPLPASNITPAALFRAIEKFHPTLLVDEADTFLATNDELRGVLNSGHTRTTAQVIRTVGEDHEPRIFSTWCPKVIALIGRLPGTLEDRAIVVSLRRRTAGEAVERLRRDRLNDRLAALRSRIARWVADHRADLQQAESEVPEALHDRAQDNWRPLLAIADLAGGDWPQRARQSALALGAGSARDDDSARTLLLADIRDLFTEQDARFLPSEEIVHALIGLEERPWADWGKGKPLTKNHLARLLRPFGVRPNVQRDGAGTARGYAADDFEDAFARYLPLQPKQPKQPTNGAAFGGFANRNTRPPVTVAESGEKPRHPGVVTVVTVADPEETRTSDGADDSQAHSGDAATREVDHAVGRAGPLGPDIRPPRGGSIRHGQSPPSPRPCRACHGTLFWTHADGRQICARCHPAVDGPNPADHHDDPSQGHPR